jgi:hypothetical protein
MTLNLATDKAGAFYLTACTVWLHDSFVNDNHAGTKGGAFFIDIDVQMNVTHTTMLRNYATSGGVFSCFWRSIVTMHKCLVASNYAIENGGAMALSNRFEAHIHSSTMMSNVAGDQGGGLYATSESKTWFSDCLLLNNTADEGGAIAVNAKALMFLDKTAVKNNSALTTAGGLSISGHGSAGYVSRSSLVGNHAGNRAGGALVSNMGYLKLENSSVVRNSACSGALVSVLGYGSVLITHSLTHNRSQAAG